MNTVSHQTGELKIPTSYGLLAAKTWGTESPDRLRVLAVHGWQDNAGTFDRLFPLLPLESLYIVALDLPGHGSSSHLPNGVPYTDMTWVIEIKRTLDFLGWASHVTIIAHSMGANASLEVATLYPDIITSLVMLDTVKLRIHPTASLATEMAKSIEAYSSTVRSNRHRPAKKYTFDLEQALNVIIQTHGNGSLTRDGAMCLLPRAVEVRSAGGKSGFTFRRDPRLNCPVYRKFDAPQLLAYLSDIRCRLLIVRAKQRHHTLRCDHDGAFLEMYRESCSDFTFQEVDGDHYVHLTHPGRVAPFIRQLLEPLLTSPSS